MDVIRDDPIIGVFVLLGVLLVLAVVFDLFRKRRGTAKPAPQAVPTAVRFSNRVEIAILLFLVVPLTAVAAAWVIGLFR